MVPSLMNSGPETSTPFKSLKLGCTPWCKEELRGQLSSRRDFPIFRLIWKTVEVQTLVVYPHIPEGPSSPEPFIRYESRPSGFPDMVTLFPLVHYEVGSILIYNESWLF